MSEQHWLDAKKENPHVSVVEIIKTVLVRYLLILYRNWTKSGWSSVGSRIEIYPPEKEIFHSKNSLLWSLNYNHLLVDVNQNNWKFDDFMWVSISLICITCRFEIHDSNVLVRLFYHFHRMFAFKCQLSFVIMFQTKTADFDLTTSDRKSMSGIRFKGEVCFADLVESCRFFNSPSTCSGVRRLTRPLYLLRRFCMPWSVMGFFSGCRSVVK